MKSWGKKVLIKLSVFLMLFSILSSINAVSAKAKSYYYRRNIYNHKIGDIFEMTEHGIKFKVQLVEDYADGIGHCKIVKYTGLDKKYQHMYMLSDVGEEDDDELRIDYSVIPNKAFYKSKVEYINLISPCDFGKSSFEKSNRLHFIASEPLSYQKTIFRENAFKDCKKLTTIKVNNRCTFEKNSFKNVKAKITYNNNELPKKSMSQIKKELKKAGFKKGTEVHVWNGKKNKKKHEVYDKFKL